MGIQKSIGVLLSAVALGMAMVPSAHAVGALGLARQNPLVSKVQRVPLGANTMAPFAYIRFCVENPQDCTKGAPTQVNWDKRTEALVTFTNRHINRTIRPVNDASERWSAGVKAGDCEDYALTKRRELVRRGIPASAMRMAVVVTPRGVGHAVLVVSTSAGDLVLDNRHNRILLPRQTDLTFVKIASSDNPRLWLSVSDHAAQSLDVADVKDEVTVISMEHGDRPGVAVGPGERAAAMPLRPAFIAPGGAF